MEECSSPLFHISWSSVTLSYLISFIISFIVVANRVSKEEFVFYLSKIATMKNIVKINHNSKIFDHFNSDGELVGITTKYNRLLELTTKDGCKEGYKKCGVLDTIGNTLCIDNNFGCPINRITVDLLANRGKHNFKGMKEIYNENLIYNYKFYYSNESLDGNATVSLLFSDERPRYITTDNFIIDVAAFKDYYDDELDPKNYNYNNDRISQGIEFGENLVNVFVSDFSVESIYKASFSLISLITDADNDKEEFKDYVQKKIENEENELDKYYKNVGENAYIKNYIGFKNLDDINTFMNFDYKIYEDIYPTKTARAFGIANGVLQIIFIAPSILITYHLYRGAKYGEKLMILLQVIATLIVNGLNIGFLSYTGWSLHKNLKNQSKIKELNRIESDDFVKGFIKEFKEECKVSSLLIPTIALLGSSILLYIIGVILILIIYCIENCSIFTDDKN